MTQEELEQTISAQEDEEYETVAVARPLSMNSDDNQATRGNQREHGNQLGHGQSLDEPDVDINGLDTLVVGEEMMVNGVDHATNSRLVNKGNLEFEGFR